MPIIYEQFYKSIALFRRRAGVTFEDVIFQRYWDHSSPILEQDDENWSIFKDKFAVANELQYLLYNGVEKHFNEMFQNEASRDATILEEVLDLEMAVKLLDDICSKR